MLETLRSMNIVTMAAKFSGSGDDGSVHEIVITRRVLKPGVAKIGQVLTADDFLEDEESLLYNEHRNLWAYANELAGEADFDWYNNEGGYGSVVVDVEAGTAEYERVEYIQTENRLPEMKLDLITGKTVV